MKRALFTASVLLLFTLAGCTGGLPLPQIVATPRVLIIVADHPESRAGEDITLRALAYDPLGRELTYTWRACLSIGAILAANDIPGPPRGTCMPLTSSGNTATVPGAATLALVEQFRLFASGPNTAFIDTLLATTGLGFTVELDISAPDGTVLVQAYKTVAIVADIDPDAGPPVRDALTTNPPPIDYLFGDRYVSMPHEGITGSGFDCVVWGEPIVLPTDTQIEIVPQGDPTSWIESYPVLGYDGSFATGMEGAYYSFHVTAGNLEAETTNPPLQNLYYTSPEEPGTLRFWLEVRDGHLGARACTFELEVVPAQP